MSASEESIEAGAEFFSHMLTNIPNLNVEQLTNLEEELTREFRLISKNYISSRLSRINKLIERINSSIKIASANDRNWSRIYNFEIETINNIKTNTEDLILMSLNEIDDKPDILKSLDEYEEELAEIVKNLQSPLAFDDTLGGIDIEGNYKNNPNNNTNYKNSKGSSKFTSATSGDTDSSKLPFPFLFEKFFKPHKQGLQTIVNEKKYQSKLILDNSLGNSTIIWKSYYNNLIRQKQALIQQTYDDLNNLHKEYHKVNYNEVNQRQWKHYYRAILNPQDIKVPSDEGYLYGRPSTPIVDTSNTTNVKDLVAANRDTNYANLDNQLLQKNKYELSQLKRQIVNANKVFDQSQKNSGDTSRKRVKLNHFSGLTNEEIDSDIQLLRRETSKLKNGAASHTLPEEISQSVVAADNEMGRDQEIEQGGDEISGGIEEEGELMNDDGEEEEAEEDEEEDEEGGNERDKYDEDQEEQEDDDEDNEVPLKSETPKSDATIRNEAMEAANRHNPEARARRKLKRKYKQLLGLESSLVSSSFRIPVLPPIESFPESNVIPPH